MLSVPEDPVAGGVPLHHADGLLVVEDGLVVGFGDYAELAEHYAEVRVEDLRGKLIVPGFVDAHVHYPQIDRIAAHGEKLLEWLDRHI
ncbi:MAG TPA: guanine deaminase, partial [Sphingomicrobium sp.]